MNWVDVFRLLILKIDLTHVALGPTPNYEGLRQQLGLTIDAALSGPRAGQWIGGRTKDKKIFLFFRVSDPSKAKQFILRSLENHAMLDQAKIRMKEKRLKWHNYAVV
jgi:hypothetical protein